MNAVDNTEVEVRLIPLAAIIIDPAVQQQAAGTSQAVVAEYAEAMRDGVKFPPIDVFRNEDGTIHLADGFHRADAHRSAHPEVQEIECNVHPGNRDDAVLFACRANAQHGLRRRRSDKVKAVTTLLGSERWSGWSDREIARQCGVSHRFVASVRSKHVETFPDAGQPQEAAAADTSPAPHQSATDAPAVAPHRRRTVVRDGKRYSMDTARIGKARSTPSRRKKADPASTLDPRAWSMSTPSEREAFVRAVGRGEIEDALNAIESGRKWTRGLNSLIQAWAAATEPELKTFCRHYYDQMYRLGWKPW
jgi:hypothetical protein